MTKAILTVGLGYGDEGKGTVVDALVRQTGSRLVVRYNGGAQAAHNVVDDLGRHHTFAQYGSGSFVPGCATLLGEHMLVSPTSFLVESDVLMKTIGYRPRVYVSSNATVTTPYHRALNRLRELYRGDARHGSCGMGIGETRSHRERFPDEAMIISDLVDPATRLRKLKAIRERLYAEAVELFKNAMNVVDRVTEAKEIGVFKVEIIEVIDEKMQQFLQCVYLLDRPSVGNLLNSEEVVVFEGAQGVLLDEHFGFHPYTTWSNTTLAHAATMAYDYGLETVKVGITRTYATRHGAGPFVSGDPKARCFAREMHNAHNLWQHQFRFGWLDLVALKYARDVLPDIDCVAITHVDSLVENDYPVVVGYGHDYLDKPVAPTDFENRIRLTNDLLQSSCITHAVDSADIVDLISAELGVPTLLTSHGAASRHKKFTNFDLGVKAKNTACAV